MNHIERKFKLMIHGHTHEPRIILNSSDKLTFTGTPWNEVFAGTYSECRAQLNQALFKAKTPRNDR